jgi:hypothetical protein
MIRENLLQAFHGIKHVIMLSATKQNQEVQRENETQEQYWARLGKHRIKQVAFLNHMNMGELVVGLAVDGDELLHQMINEGQGVRSIQPKLAKR